MVISTMLRGVCLSMFFYQPIALVVFALNTDEGKF